MWLGLRYRLNPIEQVLGNLERTELANLCLDNIVRPPRMSTRASVAVATRPGWPSPSSATAVSSYDVGPRGIRRWSLGGFSYPRLRQHGR